MIRSMLCNCNKIITPLLKINVYAVYVFCILSCSVVGFSGHFSNRFEAHQILESGALDKIKRDLRESEWSLEPDHFILKHLKWLV
jgi:hypothetical protein